MGMDVIGLCPRHDPGEIPAEAWSDERWNQTLELLARCGRSFRANVWEWRAILLFCVEAEMYEDNLDVDFRPWRFNDGAGLTTQRECDLLADSIEAHVRSSYSFEDEDDDPFETDPFFDGFVIYVDEYDEPYLVRPTDEEAAKRDYRTDGQHLWMWVAFLRNCGGFAIY